MIRPPPRTKMVNFVVNFFRRRVVDWNYCSFAAFVADNSVDGVAAAAVGSDDCGYRFSNFLYYVRQRRRETKTVFGGTRSMRSNRCVGTESTCLERPINNIFFAVRVRLLFVKTFCLDVFVGRSMHVNSLINIILFLSKCQRNHTTERVWAHNEQWREFYLSRSAKY